MATVSLTEFFPGDDFDVTDINSALASWNTASTTIKGENVREEGVSRRVIADGAVAPSNMRAQDDDFGGSAPLSAAMTRMSFGAAGHPIVGPLDWTASNSEMYISRFSCQFKIHADATGSVQQELVFDLRFGRFANMAAALASADGDWTQIVGTTRKHEFVHAPNVAPYTYGLSYYGSCTIQARFSDQLITTAGDYYICVFYSLSDPGGGSPAPIDDMYLSVMGYAR